ncbi:hypothetical protein OY671_009086, partial [Metschnikowia pulcherrima]
STGNVDSHQHRPFRTPRPVDRCRRSFTRAKAPRSRAGTEVMVRPNGKPAGLSASQARERLERDGPNESSRANRRTPLRIALEVVREPMSAMSLAAGAIYLVSGDKTEASILLLFAG